MSNARPQENGPGGTHGIRYNGHQYSNAKVRSRRYNYNVDSDDAGYTHVTMDESSNITAMGMGEEMSNPGCSRGALGNHTCVACSKMSVTISLIFAKPSADRISNSHSFAKSSVKDTGRRLRARDGRGCHIKRLGVATIDTH